MDAAGRSEEWVENQLGRLTDEYDSSSVHQTSWTVPAERYDRIAGIAADERAAAGVRVTNDDEVLLVRDRRDEWSSPRGRVGPDESLEEGAIRNVREATGIECTVEDVERISMVGVGDETDRDRSSIYCLVVLFAGSCGPDERVDPAETPVRWRQSRPTDGLDPGVLAI
jgi:ADP-ribose pyrophosphatase YjhB (NUDIX family)